MLLDSDISRAIVGASLMIVGGLFIGSPGTYIGLVLTVYGLFFLSHIW